MTRDVTVKTCVNESETEVPSLPSLVSLAVYGSLSGSPKPSTSRPPPRLRDTRVGRDHGRSVVWHTGPVRVNEKTLTEMIGRHLTPVDLITNHSTKG